MSEDQSRLSRIMEANRRVIYAQERYKLIADKMSAQDLVTIANILLAAYHHSGARNIEAADLCVNRVSEIISKYEDNHD